MLVVKKFGGTSVADCERIMNVAKRCIAEYKAGNDVVVVLSAMGKQTDVLIDMAKEAGFTYAASIDMDSLEFREDVRAMCRSDRIRSVISSGMLIINTP